MIRPLLLAVLASLFMGWLVTEIFTQIAHIKTQEEQLW